MRDDDKDVLDKLARQASVASEALQSYQPIVEEFLRTSRIPETTFGRDAVGDPNFVARMRRGRPNGNGPTGFTSTTLVRVFDYIADFVPA